MIAEINSAITSQQKRFEQTAYKRNSEVGYVDLETHCPMSADAESLLQIAAQRLCLSRRATQRITRVARTIADLNSTANISKSDVAEAIQYRVDLMQPFPQATVQQDILVPTAVGNQI